MESLWETIEKTDMANPPGPIIVPIKALDRDKDKAKKFLE
jgi:hypothetical protein